VFAETRPPLFRHLSFSSPHAFRHVSLVLPNRQFEPASFISRLRFALTFFLFTSFSFIFSVGYSVTRELGSATKPSEYTLFTASITHAPPLPSSQEGEAEGPSRGGPLFTVVAADDPARVFSGTSPSDPWNQVVRAIAECNGRTAGRVSGPDYYGLTQSVIQYWLQLLPGAKLLTKYQVGCPYSIPSCDPMAV
jgi:hypothetical protein